jgi:hypothetical protein
MPVMISAKIDNAISTSINVNANTPLRLAKRSCPKIKLWQ